MGIHKDVLAAIYKKAQNPNVSGTAGQITPQMPGSNSMAMHHDPDRDRGAGIPGGMQSLWGAMAAPTKPAAAPQPAPAPAPQANPTAPLPGMFNVGAQQTPKPLPQAKSNVTRSWGPNTPIPQAPKAAPPPAPKMNINAPAKQAGRPTLAPQKPMKPNKPANPLAKAPNPDPLGPKPPAPGNAPMSRPIAAKPAGTPPQTRQTTGMINGIPVQKIRMQRQQAQAQNGNRDLGWSGKTPFVPKSKSAQTKQALLSEAQLPTGAPEMPAPAKRDIPAPEGLSPAEIPVPAPAPPKAVASKSEKVERPNRFRVERNPKPAPGLVPGLGTALDARANAVSAPQTETPWYQNPMMLAGLGLGGLGAYGLGSAAYNYMNPAKEDEEEDDVR